jgi:hypothetical protein
MAQTAAGWPFPFFYMKYWHKFDKFMKNPVNNNPPICLKTFRP